ncbi:MAG: metal ABC transporter permease [Oscillospiraceae bacterium]|nr:metal ABC transporter permease [Oscillospiraceae bacterium]
MIEQLKIYFEYPFVRYALIVGVLVALSASLLGVTLVLKRFSFIGDGLSHVAFGVMAIASVLKLTNSILLMLPVTIICAVLLLSLGSGTKIQGDAAIAMISVGTLATGYLIMNRFAKNSNLAGDVCTTLFGSTKILTLSQIEVYISIGFSILVIAVFLVFYNKVFAITFDEDFAVATGVNVKVYNLIISIVIALVIVLAMNLVGTLLISALVVFPVVSAMRLFKSFKAVTVCAVIFSIISTILGILISIIAGTPVGSTIVAMDVLGFFVFCLLGFFIRKA